TIDIPSLQGNVDLSKVKLNKGLKALRAKVLLPDGYDEHPGQAYPLLYLLHGADDTSDTWALDYKGDVTRTAKDFPGIIVMPEGGKGWFVDWWKAGKLNGPRWTKYYLDEVVPAIEARYRVKPGRQFHAIGGVSMGGYGAMFLAGQLPGYFGTIVAMSTPVDSQDPSNLLGSWFATGSSYETVWGGLNRQYATAHNPLKTIVNVASSRVLLSVGNGENDPKVPFEFARTVLGPILELNLLAGAVKYGVNAPLVGAHPLIKLQRGVHDWYYWRRHLEAAIKGDLFQQPRIPTTAEARHWKYRTMEPAGTAWGIGYRFTKPPTKIAYLARSGAKLTGTGAGEVTVNPGAADSDASGAGTRPDCSFTATLPFERTLPDGC
ncbi:MAG: alpha/beta hydrolase-fold protein, partial [Solirubrobacteraceae bacterium]|nr:alpha/beta hydrolase-fold protein [Solirubrobacteraceae bacterium]